MIARYGPRPIVLTGRAATLHPLIADTMRASLPPHTRLDSRPCRGHHAAAHVALRAAAGTLHLPSRETDA
jgi:hypothetical protein